MHDDGLDDDNWDESAPLLPPDDRLWRHPSEIGTRPGRSAGAHPRLLAVAFVSALAGAVVASGTFIAFDRDPVRAAVERVPTPVRVLSRPEGPIDVARIAEHVGPAIAHIRTTSAAGVSSASGVVARSDGVIITNAHVVAGVDEVVVTLADGREFKANIAGADEETDVAVLRIDAHGLHVATLGSAAGLQVGEPAVAIGAPRGLAGTPSVTSGIVSALGREVEAKGKRVLFDMIETDAPLGAGSSGGALVDAAGTVIGITTAMALGDEGARMGFATPIDVARVVADQLLATGRVVHVWLGIEGTDMPAAEARELAIDGAAVVRSVAADSPADRAGLREGDAVVAIDGRPVTSMVGLVVMLRVRAPGEAIELQVRRGEETLTLTTELEARPRDVGYRR